MTTSVRLEERRNSHRRIGFYGSIFVHAALILVGTAMVSPAQWGVESRRGGGIEIHLTGRTGRVEMPRFLPEITAATEPQEPVSPSEKRAAGNASVTRHSAGGGIVEKKGGYLSNPPPRYPGLALKLGQQGKVELFVRIDRTGRPIDLSVKESSGFALLDQAAYEAVRRWKFAPARVAGLPVESTLRIPIRFRIEDPPFPSV